MTAPVTRRLVFHIGGYDPMSAEAAHRRFARELGRFRATWSTEAQTTDPEIGPDVAAWQATASGPGWSVASEIRLLRWDDVMARLAERPAWTRLSLGLVTFLDFIASGALFGYLRFAWRYALFFLYPFLVLIAFAAVALAAAFYGGRLLGSLWLGVPLGLGALAACVIWLRPRLLLDHLLDDWIFARAWIRAPDPVLGARLGRMADELVRADRGGEFGEIVLLGHSLGAVLAVEMLDEALARDPALGTRGARIVLVTVGSSIPKIGLHRGATRLRAALGRVGQAPSLFWVEYQALIDAMNFYKVDPVTALRAGPRGPLLRIVKISRMLSKGYYRRIQRNFFRVHNQFVSGNDLRTVYDYFMIVCGPWPVEAQARIREGAAAVLGPDGAMMPLPSEDRSLAPVPPETDPT